MRNFLLILLMFVGLNAAAQRSDSADRRQQRGREQLIEYRHKFLSRDLQLSNEQKAKFFELYDEMFDRLDALNEEYRETLKKADADKLSDVALDAYAKRIFEQKKLESEIELEYFDKFKQILSPRQLCKLKPAEMQILRNLNKFRRDRRNAVAEER